MKFDVCIQNPPYKRGLHVDFVNLGVAVADLTIAVHPSTPIINCKPVKRQGRELELLDNLEVYKSTIELFDGGLVFNAKIETPLSVTEINNTAKTAGVSYDNATVSLKDINIAGAWALPLFRLISNDNVHLRMNRNKSNHREVNIKEGEFYVNQCWRCGCSGIGYPNFYTMVARNKKVETERINKTGWLSWAFNTKEEAENFLSYMRTDFARMMLALYKINTHIDAGELKAVPWMDFTQEWSDEKLFRHFNVSEDDQKRIGDFIQDFY